MLSSAAPGLVVLLFLISAPEASGGSVNDGATIRASVEEVRVTFTVEDRHGRPVKELRAEDLVVLEDHRVVPRVTHFGTHAELPLRLAVMIDTSDSIRRVFPVENKAALEFLERLARPEYQATLVGFGKRIEFQVDCARNRAAAAEALQRVEPGGLTALYDVLHQTMQSWFAGDSQATARRVLVLLSDGQDNMSRRDLNSVIQLAQSLDLVVYAISVHNARAFAEGDDVLARLVYKTGGRGFVVEDLEGMEKAVSQIEEELRTQYVVHYRPEGGMASGYHHLQVRPRDARLRVRARAGYYVP